MSDINLSTDETRVSYGIGRQLGGQLRDNPPPGVSLDAILAGLTDAFAGLPSRVGEAELSASFKVIRDIMQAEAQAKAEAAAGAGLARGPCGLRHVGGDGGRQPHLVTLGAGRGGVTHRGAGPDVWSAQGAPRL